MQNTAITVTTSLLRKVGDWAMRRARFRFYSKEKSPEGVNDVGYSSFGRRMLNLVFGYDFFISYSWSDGGNYAAALARQLRSQGFEVFLDRDDYASGDDWKKVGAWKLRRTGQLVLIGSPGALLSTPVIREVQIFSGTGRRIVPIDFDGTLEWKVSDDPLAQYLPAEILRIREPVTALISGPSEQVVATIRRTFNLVRQDKKRLNALTGIAVFLAVLASVALVQSVRATRAQKVAEEQRDKAQRTLEQLSASAKSRVMGFVERAEAQAGRQEEINNIARLDASALPDLERATQLNKLSGQCFENGDFAAALKAAENATRLIVTANKISQTATDYRLTSADAYQHSALAMARLGRFEEAKKDQAASLELIQSVSSNSPEGPDLRERLAAALVNMGAICMEANEFEEAERHFHSAIKLRSEVPDLQTLPEVKRLLAAAHDRLADLEFRQKKIRRCREDQLA